MKKLLSLNAKKRPISQALIDARNKWSRSEAGKAHVRWMQSLPQTISALKRNAALRTGKPKTPEVLAKIRESCKKSYHNDPERRYNNLKQCSNNLTKMIEATKASPILGKFETNRRAKEWSLRSPWGEAFIFRNLNHFVRNHESFFDSNDVAWRGKALCGCTASHRLADLRPGKKYQIASWKGWTWYSITEQALNNGQDLLCR